MSIIDILQKINGKYYKNGIERTKKTTQPKSISQNLCLSNDIFYEFLYHVDRVKKKEKPNVPKTVATKKQI